MVPSDKHSTLLTRHFSTLQILREALLQCAPVQPAFAAPMNTNPWESPILHLDLMEMQSGCPRDVAATAFVSLSFLADPSWLLQEAEKAERPLFKRMADPCLDPCSHCANANTSRGGGFPHTSFAEPDSEKSPDSEYKTCEVPSYLYNSWSPHNGHYEAWAEAASPAGRAEHFVWPGRLCPCSNLSPVRPTCIDRMKAHTV